MGILKIKLTDAAGQALADVAVKVTGCGALQTNSEGRTQFLLEADVPVQVDINGVQAWAGSSSALAREELFQQGTSGFARVTT